MHKLGFKYEPIKKSYYVYTQKNPNNVEYRNKFIERYFDYELLTHQWYSITSEKRDEMVETGEISEHLGYKYESNGVTMWEFHVDDHVSFQSACANLPFGGFLSVRKPVDKKKAMIFGQDKVIIKQYLLHMFAWTLPDGSRPLVPKDDGMGVMISAFTSRELGFGFQMSPEMLQLVDDTRKGKRYSDEKAAISLYGKSLKQDLTSSPFVRELEYGQNKEGYWNYKKMIVQFEDCVDCLQILYPDFDFIFLFDHSNGHDRLQEDGLSVSKINVGWGGKQPKMKASKLTSSHFGPFHNKNYWLQPGDVQLMQFGYDNDTGPCNLSPSEREIERNDRDTGDMYAT